MGPERLPVYYSPDGPGSAQPPVSSEGLRPLVEKTPSVPQERRSIDDSLKMHGIDSPDLLPPSERLSAYEKLVQAERRFAQAAVMEEENNALEKLRKEQIRLWRIRAQEVASGINTAVFGVSDSLVSVLSGVSEGISDGLARSPTLGLTTGGLGFISGMGGAVYGVVQLYQSKIDMLPFAGLVFASSVTLSVSYDTFARSWERIKSNKK